MSKKNEDNIERFFRKAVKQYDAPSMESDWQKMEKMLDEEAIETAALLRAKHLRQATLSLIILLLISSGVYLFISEKNHDVSSAKNETQGQMQMQPLPEASMDAEKSKNQSSLSSSERNLSIDNQHQSSENLKKTEQENLTTRVTSESGDHENLRETDSNLSHKTETDLLSNERDVHMESGKEFQPLQNVNATTSGKTQNNYSTTLSNPDHTADDSRSTPVTEEKIAAQDSRDVEKVILAGDQEKVNPVMTEASGNQNRLDIAVENNSKDRAVSVSSGREEIHSEPVAVPVVEENVDEEIKKEETPAQHTEPSREEQEQRIPSRWNVALVLAPDFTSTVLGKYTTPGKAFGVTTGYRLFRGFTISTGFIISTKKYEGFGSDYHPPKGYWRNKTNGIIPEEIAGTCEVYEVPVTLQYLLFQKRKMSVSIGVGVSSYVMASQRYVYTYEQPNPGAAKGWATSESFSYPFNIGHFSLAFERQVFSKLAIGLEPYVKIPFTGMGWSDVDLFSTGVFMNLRYRFFKAQQTVALKNAN